MKLLCFFLPLLPSRKRKHHLLISPSNRRRQSIPPPPSVAIARQSPTQISVSIAWQSLTQISVAFCNFCHNFLQFTFFPSRFPSFFPTNYQFLLTISSALSSISVTNPVKFLIKFSNFCHKSCQITHYIFGNLALFCQKFSFSRSSMASSLVDGCVFPVESSPNRTNRSLLKLPKEARRLLQTLAMKLWSGMLLADVEDVCVHRLKGALTNEVYECFWNSSEAGGQGDADADADEDGGGMDMATEMEGKQQSMESKKNKERRKKRRVVLVRVYGEGVDLFFDREDEIHTFEAMSRAGHGPRLLGRFPNGRVEEFLHARTLTAEDLRDPDVSARIAVKLREFHQLSMPGPHEPRIWQRLRDWLQKALTMSKPEHVDEFHLQDLGVEVEGLRLRLLRLDSEIGFCHNDLQYGNIMMDEEDNTLTIIDYEYSTYNPVAYDLANHFCEMAANYHTDTPHLMDYSKYPDLQERQRFIEAYLGRPGIVVSSSQVEQLSNEVDLYALVSHIHWGLWGIISNYVNEIDFNYLEYARQRLSEYCLTKSN